jgi:exopolysaccharide biosynthesis polyprenyl glycosylphosphotransferase
MSPVSLFQRGRIFLSLLIDIVGINLAFLLAFLIRFGGYPVFNFLPYLKMRWIFVGILLSVQACFGFYRSDLSFFDKFTQSLQTFALGTLLLISVTYVNRADVSALPTSVFLIVYPLLVLFFTLGRVIERLLAQLILTLFPALKKKRKVVIVGTGAEAREFLKEFRKASSLDDYSLEGFVAEDGKGGEKKKIGEVPILGEFKNLSVILKERKITDCIITLPSSYHAQILETVEKFKGSEIKFRAVPDIYEMFVGNVTLSQLNSIPLIELIPEPIESFERGIKRLIDILVSLTLLTLASPLMLLIAFLIKLTSPGPVFYRQLRVGKDGRLFNLYKFRSMIPDAEAKTGPVWASENDPRVTRIGRILRKTSLDELPQFFLVLKGVLSLVGPRPERPHFVKGHRRLQGYRLSVQPGMTGLAQIKGRYALSIREKTRYDIFYIKHYSLALDFRILWETIGKVLLQHGVR